VYKEFGILPKNINLNDACDTFLQIAQKNHPGIKTLRCQLQTVDWSAYSVGFDYVVAWQVFGHLDDKEAKDYIKKALMCVKPGGCLIFAEMVLDKDEEADGPKIMKPSQTQYLVRGRSFYDKYVISLCHDKCWTKSTSTNLMPGRNENEDTFVCFTIRRERDRDLPSWWFEKIQTRSLSKNMAEK
jgi:hypothetical protein